MSTPSLWWIDWRLAPGKTFGSALSRCAALLVLGVAFLALLLSGGVDRFLADRWVITAVLGPAVSPEEGRGIARKVAAFSSVRDTTYKDPEAAWKEFLAAYPGLEALRSAGGNPLPGYVEIRMRPEALNASEIGHVTAVLRPLPQIEKILIGGEALPVLLRAKRWINGVLWGSFAFAAFLVASLVHLQEKGRAVDLAADFAFLTGRGVTGRALSFRRAGGAAMTGIVLSALALAGASGALHAVGKALPGVAAAVGPVRDLLATERLLAAGGFVLAVAAISGMASLLAWRASNAARE